MVYRSSSIVVFLQCFCVDFLCYLAVPENSKILSKSVGKQVQRLLFH